MAFKVTTVYTRPNLGVPWHIQWFFGKYSQQYIDCQQIYMMELRRVIKGVEGLTLTIENTWDSEEQFNVYSNNLGVVNHMARVEEYHQSCGITTEPRKFEVV
jgi:hypothetical protein